MECSWECLTLTPSTPMISLLSPRFTCSFAPKIFGNASVFEVQAIRGG